MQSYPCMPQQQVVSLREGWQVNFSHKLATPPSPAAPSSAHRCPLQHTQAASCKRHPTTYASTTLHISEQRQVRFGSDWYCAAR